MKEKLWEGPNGRYLVITALLNCILPTVAIHALLRTGHTDVIDGLWMNLNSILHALPHIKYAELAMYYGFLRGIFPALIVHDVYEDIPGLHFAHIPSFTGRVELSFLDKRGWTYCHADESLKMPIVLFLENLGLLNTYDLSNACSWLLTSGKRARSCALSQVRVGITGL